MVDSQPLTLPDDSKKAKETFNSLSLENQLDRVLRAHGQERLQYLFLSEHPEELVSKIPELEIFLTVKEIGEKDTLDLISLTTPEQFRYLLDLDLWKKDRLDPQKILHWMEVLLECGEKKVIQFIRTIDLEILALLLKKALHVVTIEGELIERDRIPLFTLDQYYFIDFKIKGAREVFQPFLQTLYRTNADHYRKLIEMIRWELESEMEEEGYWLRNSRLADYGFPDFEEALEIYRFIPPHPSRLEKRSPLMREREEASKGKPTFYLSFQKEGPFFASILSRIDNPIVQDQLRQEITTLCNKAIVAEAMESFPIEEMERVTKKVFHYLNLGLQYLSGEEETKAIEVLHSFPIQKIFQCGVSSTLLLKQRAEAILRGPWFGGNRESLLFLDPPYLEKFEGVLKKRPLIYRNGIFEDFKNLQDLEEVENFLKSLEAILYFLWERLKIHPEYLKKLDLSDCQPQEWKEITFSTVFLTALANQILRGTFRFEPIEKARLHDLFSQIFKRDDLRKGSIKMEIKNGLRGWLSSIEDDEKRRQHLLAFLDFCLDLLGEEYGKLSPEEIDPRFVRGLLIRKG